MMEDSVYTYCRTCASSCGLEVVVDRAANRVVDIKPDRANPFSWQDFCRKGGRAHEVVEHPRRLMTPMRRVGDRYEPATYEEAFADIAARLNAIVDRHGPDAIGAYAGNPMIHSFAATTFWTGLLDAIGTGNRYFTGSVDQNNVHVVSEALYGDEMLFLVPDIDACDCFLLVGTDPSQSRFTWVEISPGGWNRVLERQRQGADLIVVDPRRSETAERADTHVAVVPGEDWAFLLGVLKVILDEGLERPSTAVPLNGVAALRELARSTDLQTLAARCGVDAAVIADVAHRFARARTAMCITRTGVAQNEHGTLGEWLAHVLNLMTDRVDRPGGRRYERGYISVGLFRKMTTPRAEHHTRLRRNPQIFGHHAIAEVPDEILTPGDGQIRAMLVAFGNPVISGPDGAALDRAFAQLELLVSFDFVQRESHRHAHWLIPGTHWLEREELHPMAGSLTDAPFVQYAQRAIAPPEGMLEEWEVFAELALAMDRNLFGAPGVNRLLRVSRRLARVTGRPGLALSPEWLQRLFVLSGRRLKWSDIRRREHGWIYGEKRYGDLAGVLATPDRRVNLAPPQFVAACHEALATAPATTGEFPLLLSNKRSREAMNSWLNEMPGLFRADRGVAVDMHPDDAECAGVASGDLVRLVSPVGSIEVRARITDAMRPGVLCIPHGWGSRIFDPAGGAEPVVHGVNRNLLVDNRRLDRLSQTPALNSVAVRLERVEPAVAETVAAPRVAEG
jgi:formate dehydrogenase